MLKKSTAKKSSVAAQNSSGSKVYSSKSRSSEGLYAALKFKALYGLFPVFDRFHSRTPVGDGVYIGKRGEVGNIPGFQISFAAVDGTSSGCLKLKLERQLDRARVTDLIRGIEASALAAASEIVGQHLCCLSELRRSEMVDRRPKFG